MGLAQSAIESILRDAGAWLSGHFLLASGLHSSQYVQCQRIMQFPRFGKQLASEIAERILAGGINPSAVVGPALGAVHWELYLAEAFDRLSNEKPVRGIFAERPDGSFEIRRGIELAADESVLVCEDVTTTGGSARQVIELVSRLGAKPLGLATIIDRSAGQIDFGIPFFSLVSMDLASYKSDECPLCKEGIPLQKPGSSKLKLPKEA